ncbi:MAG: flagellar biosynthetic protein FliP [Candidatus Dadabacteria bacterium]|nr:MAG: flagellar biosynthetic protein FliP [Candidatus Dadabacteria bacterium]
MQGRCKTLSLIFILLLLTFGLTGVALAEEAALPDLSISIGGSQLVSDGGMSATLKLIFLISIVSFAPAMVLTMTCFTRIAVVLGMTRTALGTQQMPPNMVITGLSLFLTFAIMNPIFSKMYTEGARPFIDGQMDEGEAIKKTFAPLKEFLVRHAREKDLELFLEITKTEIPDEPQDVPMYVAVPAFVLSELNMAFQIGFLIALPFLVLDMVVSSVLTSMSMITLPPVVISLPLKLMLFVIVDGWHLIVSSLVQTYQV